MASESLSFSCWPWQHWASVKPEATAVILENGEVSWQQLIGDIAAVPMLPGDSNDCLGVVVNNDYRTLLVLLAAWQQGRQTLLLNPAFTPELQQQILHQAGVEAVIEAASMALAIPAGLPDKIQPFDAERVLSLVLTSGSTGTPKAVAHAAKHHLASATGLFHIMPFGEQDCWLLSLPVFHVSGLAIVWRWLAAGSTLKIADTKGDALLTALQGASHASLVPTQLQRLLHGAKPDTLQSVLLGGAVIPQTLVDKAENQGIRCWCGYGMTEMASTITAKRADGRFSVGSVLANRQLMLSPQGEVLVAGETLSPGYLMAGKLVPLTENWFATKDQGQWITGEWIEGEERKGESAKDELRILGRLDNMFICGGENVQPESVERVLAAYPKVEQVFVLPVEDEKWGQVPVALVQGNVDTDAFLIFAKAHLPAHQVPKKVLFIPIALTQGSGIKLSRRELAQWLAVHLNAE